MKPMLVVVIIIKTSKKYFHTSTIAHHKLTANALNSLQRGEDPLSFLKTTWCPPRCISQRNTNLCFAGFPCSKNHLIEYRIVFFYFRKFGSLNLQRSQSCICVSSLNDFINYRNRRDYLRKNKQKYRNISFIVLRTHNLYLIPSHSP